MAIADLPLPLPPAKAKAPAFDPCDVPARCRDLLQRLATLGASTGPVPWIWDILETLEDSRTAFLDVRRLHAAPSAATPGPWQELCGAVGQQGASSLPSGLRKQCADQLENRESWLEAFNTEAEAAVAQGEHLREQLLFESGTRSGWFGKTSVGPLDVQRLLERHVELHLRAARLENQLLLLSRSLRQQGAISCRRRPFAERTVGDKLQSSLVTLAASALVPVPGSLEIWLASNGAMWLNGEEATKHVIYEHSRDTDIESMLKTQFQCVSTKAQEALRLWLALPPGQRRGRVLVHNASIRRVALKTRLVNCIDGQGAGSKWTSAFDDHPLSSVIRGVWGGDTDEGAKVVIGAQRLAVVELQDKPDTNWGWRGAFSYGDTKVGECALREGGIFSFICVDCGLRVGDRGEGESPGEPLPRSPTRSPTRSPPQSPPRSPPQSPPRSPPGSRSPPSPGSRSPTGSRLRFREKLATESEVEGTTKTTTVEIVNGIKESVMVKVFEPGAGGHSTTLFRQPLAEGSVGPDARRCFLLPAPGDSGQDASFDVELVIHGRKAFCEVVGEQVVFVDGVLG